MVSNQRGLSGVHVIGLDVEDIWMYISRRTLFSLGSINLLHTLCILFLRFLCRKVPNRTNESLRCIRG